MATDNFDITTLVIGQTQKETTINDAFFEFDALTTGAEALANSPSITTNGTVYMIDTAPTGAFDPNTNDEHANKLAIRINGGWVFKTIQSGFTVWNIAVGTLYRHDGTNWQEVTLGGGGGGGTLGIGTLDLLHVRDEQAANTDAGTFTSGAWQTRALNTVKTNEISGASLSSNQMTLPAGSYEIDASAPAYKVVDHKARLWDTTGSAMLIIGSSETTNTGTDGETQSWSTVRGQFTLTVESVLELQHRCDTTFATIGLGRAVNLDTQLEVYAEVRIRRIQPVLTSPGLPFKGALVNKSGNQSLSTGTFTALSFDQETYDVGDWHDNVTDNTRMTVPAGITKVRITGGAQYAGNSTGRRFLLVHKNGSAFADSPTLILNATSGNTDALAISSNVIEVVAGDYFELVGLQDSGSALNVEAANSTWFGIEAIEAIAPSTRPRGALVNQVTSFSLPNNTTTTATWDNEIYDTDNIHDNVTNNSRLTVPTGVTHIRLTGAYRDESNTTGWRFVQLRKNGGSVPGLSNVSHGASGANSHFLNLSSPVLEVIAGDYFEMQLFQNSGSTRAISGDNFWFAMEIVEPAIVAGGAGKQEIWIPVSQMEPTVTAGCAAFAVVESVAGQPDQHVLGFDTTTKEHAQFLLPLPKRWDKGLISFQAFWTHQGGQTGGLDGVVWALQGLALADDDAYATAFGTAIVVTDDKATGDDLFVTAESAAVTIAGTPGNNEMVVCDISRDVDDAADDLDIDAQLVAIKVFYTSDKSTDD